MSTLNLHTMYLLMNSLFFYVRAFELRSNAKRTSTDLIKNMTN